MTDGWLALHVFTAGDLDPVVRAMGTQLEALSAAGQVDRWFYVRYWNGGPHVRVRARCSNTRAVERALRRCARGALAPCAPLEPSVYARNAAHLLSTERSLGGDEVPTERAESLQHEGSIQRRPYVFDARRYGGADAAPAAHDHAWVSSRLALAVLGLLDGRAALRAPFALHAAAVAASLMEVPPHTVVAYFEEASRWAGSSPALRSPEPGMGMAAAERLARGQDADLPPAWALLVGTWRGELQRRQAELGARPTRPGLPESDLLLLDALHLFLNRLGVDLGTETGVYRRVADLMRERINEGGRP